MESTEELRQRLQEHVTKDKELEARVNEVMHTCREQITELMTRDAKFGTLFSEYHFSGSYYDKLAVGDIRHEYDLNIVFGIPEASYVISAADRVEDANFMPVKVLNQSNPALMLVSDNGFISAAKMREVVRTALKRALTQLQYRVMVNRQGVRISLSEKGLPLTLTLRPENSITPKIEVDLAPVLRLHVSKLPYEVQQRVNLIQDMVDSPDHLCLAVALPIVHTDLLEIDFPQAARAVLANRPAAKMAVRLLKQERDCVGGHFKEIKSFTIKMAALIAVLRSPDPEEWVEARLGERYQDVRRLLQDGLVNNNLPDIFFPSINLMDRYKDPEVKSEVGRYLQQTSGSGYNFEKIQTVTNITKRLVVPISYFLGSRHYSGSTVSIEVRKAVSYQIRHMLRNLAQVYNGEVARVESQDNQVTMKKVQNSVQNLVNKIEEDDLTWSDSPNGEHEQYDVTLKIPMRGGPREGRAMNLSFNWSPQ